ncbi:MAG: response regulator [Anaerolineae bacterium]|nr:response regulator [Anaerolineae bacterium]
MKTLLVIDDTPELRNELLQLLEWEGYRAIGAEDGPAAIALARAHHPDLILCDIMMPGLDGYETMTAIRQDVALAHTPFIFLTARTGNEERQRGLAFGALAYLSKPFSSDTLLATIAKGLSQQPQQTETPAG